MFDLLKLPVDGEIAKMQIENPTFRDLRDMINARNGEYVCLMHNKLMLCDEEAILTDKPINPRATQLVGSPIFGDVLIYDAKDSEDLPYE